MTTEFADWATDCPEYKVTAVQVRKTSHRSPFQDRYAETRRETTQHGRRRRRGPAGDPVKPSIMVHRANQIALFFASYSREEAVAGVADHLKKSLEPRMRRQLAEYVAADGAGLDELAKDAIKKVEPLTTR